MRIERRNKPSNPFRIQQIHHVLTQQRQTIQLAAVSLCSFQFVNFLVPTFEFQQALWQHMEHIEILAPDWLREETQYKIKTLYEKYWK